MKKIVVLYFNQDMELLLREHYFGVAEEVVDTFARQTRDELLQTGEYHAVAYTMRTEA